MPEPTLTEDETRAAFAGLRGEVLPRVVVPGAGAARRQLRHRRHWTAAATGVAVTAVAGGTAIGLAPEPPAGEVPAPTTAAAPPPSSTPVVLYPESRDDTLILAQRGGAAGRQKLVILCSGAGSGQATLAAGGATATAQVNCGVPPIPREIEIDVPTDGAELTLRIAWGPGHRFVDTAEGWALAVWGPE